MNYKYIQNPLGMAGIYIAFGKAGAIGEKDGKYGTSHLMEHMICKNSDSMRDVLQQNGIFPNAFTGTDKVVCHMSGLADRMAKFTPEYIERMLGSIDEITEDQFQNEKSTVLQEYGDSFVDPLQAALWNAMRKHFNCYMSIGRRRDIEAFTFEDYKKAYVDIFSKPDLILYIGPDDPSPAIPVYPPVHIVPNTYAYTEDSGAELEEGSKNDRSQIIIFPKELVGREYATAAAVAFKMLASGLNSPLMIEAREKRGLTYGVCGFINSIGPQYLPTICTSTDNDNQQKLLDVIMEVFANPDKYLTQERFEVIRGMVLVKKQKEEILLYDNPSSVLNESLGFINEDSGIETITYDHALAAAKKFFSPDSVGVYVE